MKNILLEKKRGQFQIASSSVYAVLGFLLAVIITLLVVGILVGGGFFTAGSASQGTLDNISSNLTAGVNSVVGRMPVLFTIVGLSLVLGFIALLILVIKRAGIAGGGNFGQ